MVRLFISTLKGVAFDWFRSLPSGSVNSWINLETWFLSRFYEDDTEVTVDKLLSTVQKGREFMREYIKRFRNFSLMCLAGMSLHMLLQTCRHNFLDRIEVRMGAVKAHTWMELVEQAEIAEISAKNFEPSVPKNKWGVNTRRRDAAQSSQSKGKRPWSLSYQEQHKSKQKSNTNGNQEFKFPPKVYSFKDESRWWQASICYTRVTSLTCLKFGDLTKWGVQLIQITAPFISWYITLPTGGMSSKIRSKPW